MNGPNGDTVPSGREPDTPPGASDPTEATEPANDADPSRDTAESPGPTEPATPPTDPTTPPSEPPGTTEPISQVPTDRRTEPGEATTPTEATAPTEPIPPATSTEPIQPAGAVTAPQPMPATATTGPPPDRSKRRRWVLVLVVVLVVLLAGGGVAWVLTRGAVPTDLQVAESSFGSITLSWAWDEDRAPTGFVILRDGVELATVPGTETSFEDTDVQPATEYTYAVHAELDGEQSDSGAELTASTEALPAPSNLQTTDETFSSVVVEWDFGEVPPDEFVVTRDGVEHVRVTGQELGFLDGGLDPGTTYTYTVAAVVGGATGEPSAEVSVTTPEIPPLSEAEFSGAYDVTVQLTGQENFPGVQLGRRSATTPWQFEPRARGPKVTAFFFGPPAGGWTMNMQGSGRTYRDRTKASQSNCAGVPVVDTIEVEIRIEQADIRGGEWLVTKWSGTLRLESPQANSGIISCPPGSLDADLTGRLQ